MKTYFVKPGDTPKSITESKTGDYRKVMELLNANPRKKTIFIADFPTFETLTVGEQLNLPDNWPCCAKCGQLGALCDNCREDCGGKGGGCLGFISQEPISTSDVYTPIIIGVAALAAGLGLAYIVTRPPKSVAEITQENSFLRS